MKLLFSTVIQWNVSIIQVIASLGIHFIFIHAIIYIEIKDNIVQTKKPINIIWDKLLLSSECTFNDGI